MKNNDIFDCLVRAVVPKLKEKGYMVTVSLNKVGELYTFFLSKKNKHADVAFGPVEIGILRSGKQGSIDDLVERLEDGFKELAK